jgi:hypothetical protein
MLPHTKNLAMGIDPIWKQIAERIILGLNVQSGELILVRDMAGQPWVLQEMVLAIEKAGATALVEFVHSDFLFRLLTEAPVAHLMNWDRYRQQWIKQADRLLVLTEGSLDFSQVPGKALDAWTEATRRIDVVEEERPPFPVWIKRA